MSIPAAFLVPHPPLIIPEIGGGREAEIAETAESYLRVAERIAEIKPDTIVIFSPHSTVYADYIHISPGIGAKGNMRQFGAKQVTTVKYDEDMVHALEALCKQEQIHAGTRGEKLRELDHGTLIPLYFINQKYTDYKLVRISPSGLPREEQYRFGMLLRQVADTLDRSVVLVASGDLSHKLTEDGPYGYAPEGPALDAMLTGIMSSGAFDELFALDDGLCSKGAECGYIPILMMAGALDGLSVDPDLLSYQGTFGVGYAVASFEVTGEDDARCFLDLRKAEAAHAMQELRIHEDPYVRLARTTLEEYVRTGKTPPMPSSLPEEMLKERAGVFVSIKKNGQLRGCIGTTSPTKRSLAEEIRQNAISSGTKDPRFAPVQAAELGDLVYSVDVLMEPEPADDSMLDPERYGVIVSNGYRRGLLLPMLEGVNTVAEQVEIARRKAGIPEDKPYTLERFEVVRHT